MSIKKYTYRNVKYQNVEDENDIIRISLVQSWQEIRTWNSVNKIPGMKSYHRADSGKHMNPYDLEDDGEGVQDIHTMKIYRRLG